MNISSIIDLICAYLNTLSSFFSTVQRLKNEFHATEVDYSALIMRLVTQTRADPETLGVDSDMTGRRDASILAALVCLAVYKPDRTEDWTTEFTPNLLLRTARSSHSDKFTDPWYRGRLKPTTINLQEAHYMTSSKAFVYMAVYRPLESVVLSLPGTNSRTDWLSNLHSTTVDLVLSGTTVKVHQGFLYIAQCLATHPSILKFLREAHDAGIYNLLLCGHSEAGAVVSLLSGLLSAQFDFEIDIITFGSGACLQTPGISTRNCTSFIRSVRQHSTAFADWQVDPVPLLDDAVLSQTQSLAMYPMGAIINLLDHGTSTQIRRLDASSIRQLLSWVLLNFSADPHSMHGYAASILSLFDPAGQESMIKTVEGAFGSYELHVSKAQNFVDDAMAERQLTRSTEQEDRRIRKRKR